MTALSLPPVLPTVAREPSAQWPSDDSYNALLALLDQRIHDPGTDQEMKSKLERLRGTLVDVGKGAAGGVLASLVRYGLRLP
jgi:hypothetical protein